MLVRFAYILTSFLGVRVTGSQPTICPFELALHTVEFLRKVKFVKLEVFTHNKRQQQQHIVAIKMQLIRAIWGIISGSGSFQGQFGDRLGDGDHFVGCTSKTHTCYFDRQLSEELQTRATMLKICSKALAIDTRK